MSFTWSPSWTIQLVLFSLSLSFVSCVTGDEVDYSDQLRPIPALSPQEALKTFHVAEGFQVELAAAEPNVVDPVAMAFDADGRLFVIEMRGYSEDDGQVLGRVRLLEDKDDDGHYETSSVFAEGLSWPTAITCTFDGVLVGAAPDLIFLKDLNGDGKADQRQVVFTGFRKSNVQGLLNTFKWGLDNRIHGVTSSSGAAVQAVVDDQPTGEPTSLSGRDFSIEPRTMTLSPTSGGGQHGMSFDAWGNKFTCSNSDHLQQVVYDDHYMARNPYVSPPSARRSIAEDGPQAEVYRTSPVEAWRVIRTRLRTAKIVPGVVEGGGRAAGYFTGATGVTIFRGNGWPADAEGLAIIGDVGSNLVHRKHLVDNGILFRGVRVDQKSELLSSSDIWFRPVQYANAPDGSLYVADMYREVIEHPKSLPPMIKKHLDLTSGRDRGRIYRIIGDQFKRRPAPRLSQMTTTQLVALLDHPNGWHRETASRLIFERQDTSVTPTLSELVSTARSAQGRMHALYALQGLEQLTTETLLTALSDTDPRVQQHAIRLSESLIHQSATLRERIRQLVDSPDDRIRFQLAFSIGEFPVSEKTALLARLVATDGDDPYFRAAIQSSTNEGAGMLLRELASDFKRFPEEMLGLLASQIGKQQSSADVATVLQLLEQLQDDDNDTFQKLVTAFNAKPGSKLSQQLAVVTQGASDQVIANMVQDAISVLEDEEASNASKKDAVALLRFQPFDATRFGKLLQPSQSIELQREALQVMSQFDSPEVADLLLDNWQGIGPGLRASAFDVVLSRPVWVGSLLDAIDSEKLPIAEVNVARLVELKPVLSESQRKKIAALEKHGENSNRVAVVDSYRSALTIDGSADRGEKLFLQHCSACHHLNGKGHPIGPNLAAMKNRGAEAILVNVLRPNMEVNPQYMNYICLTQDGRTISGMIANETATTITLVQADNKTETILRLDIEQLRSTGVSLMPEGLEKVIDTESMADLLKYLSQQ